MKALDPRNPLVALVRERKPGISDADAMAIALNIRRRFAESIDHLGELAEYSLTLLGGSTDQELVKLAAGGFLVDMVGHGTAGGATLFLAAIPEFYKRLQAVTTPSELDAGAVRKLLLDCVAMKTGGPAAE